MTSEFPEIVIIGGGGHAKVLIDALRAAGSVQSIGILDADKSLQGSMLLGERIAGDDSMLETLAANGTRYFAIGVGGTGNNGPRKKLFERAVLYGLCPVTIVHPTAVVSKHAQIGPGCQILAGAIVNASARLGTNAIVNTAAVVEHDCNIGDHVHIASGACLASTVNVAAGAHIGLGAVVRQLVRIGANAIVGAGAVVVKDVEPNTVVAGVPAKEIAR